MHCLYVKGRHRSATLNKRQVGICWVGKSSGFTTPYRPLDIPSSILSLGEGPTTQETALSQESTSTLSLFCASLEEELCFRKLPPEDLESVITLRDNTVFPTDYAKLVVYAVLGKEAADQIWQGNVQTPKRGGAHTLFELYWIATTLNPELAWSLKTSHVERSGEKTLMRPTKKLEPAAEEKPLGERLTKIETFLRGTVVGQEEALETVLDVLYRTAAGLGEPDRPMAVLLFTGPSGVGKTHLAKCLTAAMYEEDPSLESIVSPKAFMRIDCTLYQQKHEISNLIGSPQGYIGSDLGSPLPDFLRENESGNIILIDEVEKAHPSLHKIFMGLFDYGSIKDNKQKEASAINTIFIMTSNAGSREASKEMDRARQPLGFGAPSSDAETLTARAYKKKLEEVFPPEFRGRIDEVVIFKQLDEQACRSVLELEVGKLENRLKAKNLSLTVTEGAKQTIIKQGFSTELGARHLHQVMREQVVKPLSRLIVCSHSRSFIVRGREGQILVETKQKRKNARQ